MQKMDPEGPRKAQKPKADWSSSFRSLKLYNLFLKSRIDATVLSLKFEIMGPAWMPWPCGLQLLRRSNAGIGGVTRQLDVVPRPCHMCMVKIVTMAQSIYQVDEHVYK